MIDVLLQSTFDFGTLFVVLAFASSFIGILISSSISRRSEAKLGRRARFLQVSSLAGSLAAATGSLLTTLLVSEYIFDVTGDIIPGVTLFVVLSCLVAAVVRAPRRLIVTLGVALAFVGFAISFDLLLEFIDFVNRVTADEATTQ